MLCSILSSLAWPVQLRQPLTLDGRGYETYEAPIQRFYTAEEWLKALNQHTGNLYELKEMGDVEWV